MSATEYRAIGPPGCGKTTWLAKQVARAVAKHGPSSVLLASLTRAAAAELGGRGMDVDEQAIGTLHAHAYRALNRPQLAQDKKHVEAWNAHVSKSGREHWRLSTYLDENDMGKANTEDGTEGDGYHEQAETYRHKCIPFDQWPNESVKAWFEGWQDFKEMSYAMDFTDMIVKATEVIDHAPGDPRFIFLDEAQDLSLLELTLARKWADRCETFIMVGDPDQCLYEWRGSSPLNFENPKLPEERYKYLSQSYRVPAAVHRVAVKWIEQIKNRRPVEYHPRRDEEGNEVEGKCRILMPGELSYQDAEELIRDAKQYLDEGKTVMFLGTAGYMLNPLVKHMREEGMTFHNPYNRKRGDWNPLGSRGRRGSISMHERVKALTWGDWLQDKRALRIVIEMLKLEHFRNSKSINTDYIMKLTEGTVHGDELNRIFTEEAMAKMISMDLDWFKSGLKAQYKTRSFDYCKTIVEKHGEVELGNEPKIIVGTIHSVKGGEADVVYVFPELSPAADDMWQGTNEDRAGVYRAFYVAMTRAREELVLCGPSKSGRSVDWPL